MEDLEGLRLVSSSRPVLLRSVHVEDRRGVFEKPFPARDQGGLEFEVLELFWSSSSRGSIRGMHFQTPPSQIAKIVWVSVGSIVDVVVDLRRGPGLGSVASFELSASAGDVLWIPAWYAHGFQSLEDGTVVNYATDGLFDPERDAGVHWSSIGFDWPLPPTAVSDRDAAHPALADFETPFA